MGPRIAGLVVSLLVASLLIFLATNALPGDVAQILLGVNAAPGEVEAMRERFGLNAPLLVRYVEWLGGVLRGDFGTSMSNNRDVGPQISGSLGVSLWLVGLSTALAVLIALPLGAVAAINRRNAAGFLASAFAQVGLSIPAFWAGIWLVLVFAVRLEWFPAGGYVELTVDPRLWAKHLVLPVVALALVQASILSRYVRSAVIEVLGEDWFRTARSVGWSTWGALVRHGSRNIAISLLTVIGLQISTLLVGAIIIEQVFALNGLGWRLIMAVGKRDLVMVQAIVLLLVWAVLLINFVVDVTYSFVDPRISRARGQR